MIICKETGRRWDYRGVDVTVQFLDKDLLHMTEEVVQTTTFHFVNEKEVAHDLDNRCRRKIEGIEYDLANPPKPELSRNEVEEKLKELGHLAEGKSFEDMKIAEARLL